LNTSTVSIIEGQHVSILCTIKGGNPKAQITWDCFSGTTTDVSTATESWSVITVVGMSNQHGQLCTCRGQHDLVIIEPAQVTFNVGCKYYDYSLGLILTEYKSILIFLTRTVFKQTFSKNAFTTKTTI